VELIPKPSETCSRDESGAIGIKKPKCGMQVLAQQITKQETCNRDKIHNKEKTSLF
jgi:hypothetical protein